MDDYGMGYMMGGSHHFLSRGEAWEFNRLFLCEGDKETVDPDTILFCCNDTYYVIWTWEKAHPLKTSVIYLKDKAEIESFLASYNKKEFPLVACDQVDSIDENLDIVHYKGTFRRDTKAISKLADSCKILRVVLADFEEKGISKRVIRKDKIISDSFSDENITVGTAANIGPFSVDGSVDDSQRIYIVGDSFSIAVPIDGGDYALDFYTDNFTFDSPEKLIASILGTEEIEFDDLGLPEEYRHDEEYYRKLDNYEFEFMLIDEDAWDPDFPTRQYICRFSDGWKEVITTRNSFFKMVQNWIKYRPHRTLYMTAYRVIGDW